MFQIGACVGKCPIPMNHPPKGVAAGVAPRHGKACFLARAAPMLTVNDNGTVNDNIDP